MEALISDKPAKKKTKSKKRNPGNDVEIQTKASKSTSKKKNTKN
jgi:hypothetical protein